MVRSVGLLVVGSVALWLVAAVAAPLFRRELLFGMAAPLAAAVVGRIVVGRTFRRHPQGVTGVMMVAFGVKLLFFGAYVVAMLRGLMLRPVPFAVGFTAYFIGLHAADAWWLQRLLASGGPGPRT